MHKLLKERKKEGRERRKEVVGWLWAVSAVASVCPGHLAQWKGPAAAEHPHLTKGAGSLTQVPGTGKLQQLITHLTINYHFISCHQRFRLDLGDLTF